MTELINQEEKRIAFGGAIKALNDGIIEGYLIKFTSPERRDLYGEYFDASTNLWIDDHPIDNLRVIYHHGLDDTMRVKTIGNVIRTRIDDVGVWVQAQLALRDEYERAIYQMAKLGKLGWSSGALPGSTRTSSDGHVEDWAIAEGSMTPTPAMPLDTQITTLKALQVALRGAEPREADVQDDLGRVDAGVQNAETSNEALPNHDQQETHKMDIKTVKALSLEQVKEQLVALLEAMSMTDPEIEASALEAMQTAAQPDIEELARAAAGSDDDEMQKAVNLRFAEIRAELMKAGTDAIAKFNREQKNREAAKRVALEFDREPIVSPKRAAGAPANGNISVSENLKYAHLTGSEMAAGLMMRAAGMPGVMRERMTIGTIVSDDYANHMAQKMMYEFNQNAKRDIKDHSAIKAALPFRANELDATNITGQGLEWVGVYYSTTLWERARAETELYDKMVAKGMMVERIEQGASSIVIPLDVSDPTVYTTAQANSLDATMRPEVSVKITPFGTGNVTITPATQKLATSYTVEMEEDAMIRLAPFVNSMIVAKMAENQEYMMINGDTQTAASTNINLIDGTPTPIGVDGSNYLGFNGFRKYVLITYSAKSRSGGALDVSDFRATLSLLDSTIRSRRDKLLWIMDFSTEGVALGLAQWLTVDVAGQQNTLFTGVLPKVLNIDNYVSGQLELADSAGKITAAHNGTTGTLLLTYAPNWAYVYKRDITIETDRDILSGTNVYVASVRHALAARGANAAAGTYNITV